MSIPKYRYVKYLDDGVCQWQCLSCYETVATGEDLCAWTYCPKCGIKWEGCHACRDHSTPRWAYETKSEHDPWPRYRHQGRLWVIDWRYTRKAGVWTDWLPYAQQGFRRMGAKRVKETLERYRENDFHEEGLCEYRARLSATQQTHTSRTFY